MSTIEVNTINPQSGNDITIGGSSKNVKFPSGTTVDFNTNTPTLTLGAAMKMTPAFLAYSSVDQTLSNTTITKVSFNTEIFDSDNAYDNSTNYRFTPQEAGKYYVGSMCTMQGGTSNLIESRQYIYKNGSVYSYAYQANQNNYSNYQTNYQGIIMDMNGSSDYAEIYAYISRGGSTSNLLAHTKGIYFMGYKVIGA